MVAVRIPPSFGIALRAMRARAGDIKPVLDATISRLQGMLLTQFQTSVSIRGGGWKQLSDLRLLEKEKAKQSPRPLIATGALKQGVTAAVVGDRIRISYARNTPYGAPHQWSDETKSALPRRPFLPLVGTAEKPTLSTGGEMGVWLKWVVQELETWIRTGRVA